MEGGLSMEPTIMIMKKLALFPAISFIFLFPRSAYSCSDTTLRLRIVKPNGGRTFQSCTWVETKPYRCSFDGVRESCPLTCDACDECKDSPLRLKITKYNGKKINRDCRWVANNPTSRCRLMGVANACRKTCGTCETTTDNPTKSPTAPSPTPPTTSYDNFIRFESACQNPMTLQTFNGINEGDCVAECEQKSSTYLIWSFKNMDATLITHTYLFLLYYFNKN